MYTLINAIMSTTKISQTLTEGYPLTVYFSLPRSWVQSPVRELRSYVLCGVVKKIK